MREEAQIIITANMIANKGHYFTFEWEGKRHWQINLRYDYFEQYGKLPWPLMKLEDAPERGGYWYARKDGFNLPYACLVWLWVRVRNTWYGFYARVIATMAIWGMAYIPMGEIPSWRHIGLRRKKVAR